MLHKKRTTKTHKNWTTKTHINRTFLTLFKTTIKQRENTKTTSLGSCWETSLEHHLTRRTVFLRAGLQALNGGTGQRERPVCGRICTVREHVLFRASSSTNGTFWRSACEMQNCYVQSWRKGKQLFFNNSYFLLNSLTCYNIDWTVFIPLYVVRG